MKYEALVKVNIRLYLMKYYTWIDEIINCDEIWKITQGNITLYLMKSCTLIEERFNLNWLKIKIRFLKCYNLINKILNFITNFTWLKK